LNGRGFEKNSYNAKKFLIWIFFRFMGSC
jgi:hypothetical protein